MLIFASNNENKVKEVNALLHGIMEVISLKEAGIMQDIPEPFLTLEENATTKSATIYQLTGRDCFSEDTGLEVQALDGRPGVKSARYNEEGVFGSNIDKLLFELKNKPNRSARFRTVISLIMNGKEFQFEGICNGQITEAPKGHGGFGYDPVFIPDGAKVTFGEMEMDEKNQYSHRKKAVAQLLNFLKTTYGKN